MGKDNGGIQRTVEALAGFIGTNEEEVKRLLLAVGARTLEAYLEGVDTPATEVYNTTEGET